jgi:hypothetical protein
MLPPLTASDNFMSNFIVDYVFSPLTLEEFAVTFSLGIKII